MAPICGRPFLEWLLDYWISQGISRFVLSVGYKQEIIVNHFGGKYKNAIIDYSSESTPLGTGGGFLLALKHLNTDSPFLLLNGDTFFEARISDLYMSVISNCSECCMSLFKANQESRYMRVQLSGDKVINLGSEKAKVGNLANGGVYLFAPQIITRFSNIYPENKIISLEDNLLPALFSEDGGISAETFEGRFIDIGLPADYDFAQKLFNGKDI